MSWEAFTWALNADIRPVGAKFVLTLVAYMADENGSCFPSQDYLAAYSCQSRATVGRQLRQLEEEGWLRRERQHGLFGQRKSDRYFLSRRAELPAVAYVSKTNVGNEQKTAYDAKTNVGETAGLSGNGGEPTSHIGPNLSNTVLQEKTTKRLLKDDGTNNGATRRNVPTSAAVTLAGGEPLFDLFWDLYPRKVSKGSARKMWAAAMRAGADPAAILEGVKRYAEDPNLPAVPYRPHPSTWLSGERWLDAPEPARVPEDRQAAVLRAEMETARAADAAAAAGAWLPAIDGGRA